MKRKEATELVIADKCDGCEGFYGCDAADDFEKCDGFKEKIEETLKDQNNVKEKK